MSGNKKKSVYIDSKLKVLVGDFINSQDNPNRILADDVVDYLQTHVEYTRKNRQALKLSAIKAMEQIRLQSSFNSNAERKEEVAKSTSKPIVLIDVPDHNSLNQSLQKAYSKLEPTTPQTPERDEMSDNRLPRKRIRINGEAKRKKSSLTDSLAKQLRGGFAATPVPEYGYEAMGGVEDVLQQVREVVERPFLWPEVYEELRVRPPSGILLHGPPGCGKTFLAHAIAGELGRKLKKRKEELSFFRLAAPEMVSNMSGESESNIRGLFEMAKSLAPCLIFIDEIDVICPKRDSASKEMEKRIVAQLLSCFDDLNAEGQEPKRVMVIGATNRVDSLDSSLRRGGRFEKEIPLGVPNDINRAKILEVQVKKLKVDGSFDYLYIARKTPGFVGADLSTLATEAAAIAVERVISQLEQSESSSAMDTEEPNEQEMDDDFHSRISPDRLSSIAITMSDFEAAIPKVQPSAKREGFATVPNVTWEEVGALDAIRQELRANIIHPIKSPEDYRRVGLDSPAGVLLYGPPGCGKTLLAKAIANDCSASFISVKGPELLNKYVGESERSVRKVFERAKLSKPCIIFFDEIDALCPRRDDDGNSATKRVVNQLLTEMDGLEERKDIFIIAATNRPDMIDPAMLRPQRLDKLLYVPLPSKEDRVQILRTLTRRMAVDPNVNLVAIAESCDRFSGADLSSLAREASIVALTRHLASGVNEKGDTTPISITPADWEVAVKKTRPSVSVEDENQYIRMAKLIRSNKK